MRRGIGIFLIGISLLSIVQSVREIVLFEVAARRYDEESLLARPFAFGGHDFSVEDNHPYIPPEPGGYTSETGYPGKVRVLMDGEPLTETAHAIVRPGRNDLGRYHLWFDVWIFSERGTGERTLWMAQRIQEGGARFPEFEVITVTEGGILHRQRLRWYQLGQNYPLFRATQFVSDGSFYHMPLSMTEAAWFPPLLIVFPFGSLVLGLFMARKHRRLPQPTPT